MPSENAIDWADWTRRLARDVGALLADAMDAEEAGQPVPSHLRELFQGAVELEAEAHHAAEEMASRMNEDAKASP